MRHSGMFKVGNKIAEKWTEKEVLKYLGKIWETLVEPDEQMNDAITLNKEKGIKTYNFVRANDIKTLNEALLINGLTKDWWSDIKDRWKIKRATAVKEGKRIPQGVNNVLRAFDRIETVIEARLIYSGSGVDILILKTKYGHSEFQRNIATTPPDPSKPAGSGNAVFQRDIIMIPAENLSRDEIESIVAAQSNYAVHDGVSSLIGGI